MYGLQNLHKTIKNYISRFKLLLEPYLNSLVVCSFVNKFKRKKLNG